MTVGSMARQQFNMARVQTQYGSGLDSLYGSQLAKIYGSSKSKAATKSLEDLLKSNALKNKSDIFREQFSDLYKSIFGSSDGTDDSSDYSSLQSIKTASASAGGAAESIKSYANSLKYGGEVDVDTYKAYAQSFVDSYNGMIDKVGNAESMNILQKGVLMTNTGKVYSSALKRAGITVGSDNKLTLNDDLSGVKALDIKTVFGNMGFSDKVIQKAGQINSLSGGNGMFTAGIKPTTGNGDGNVNSATEENAKTLKEVSVAVNDLATNLKSYVSTLGSEDKEFVPQDFTDLATSFADSFNSLLDQMAKSDKSSVQSNGVSLQSMARSYKFALDRVGISVDNNGRMSVTDAIKNATKEDIQYSFGTNSFLDKVIDKAKQTDSLVSSASAMGYGADKTTTYAYNIGALFSMYA